MTNGFFPDFTVSFVETPLGAIRIRTGGTGFPVLLLHGHPRTHTTWYKVAPLLAQDFTVICADLPGFGQSYRPEEIEGSSGRAKAKALHACMSSLGHDRFGVAGHDRGSYRAFRLAMDFPESVAGLVMMDGVPIYEALERADWRFARDWWHWFFFAQSDKAESAILADPELWYPTDAALGIENRADYVKATRDPSVVRSMLADYRAGLEYDYDHDHADRKVSRYLQCPLGLLWSAHDDMETIYGDPSKPWADWSSKTVMKERIMSGHHMAEEAPEDVALHLRTFFMNHR
ncbi:alpha/beta fold hydrolase [Paracoccus alkanivorans]|uniref:Alpha/beta hydrolase n=1 Tax=Paracoccus alkanivorans TaxID=2116655 RepID=A0A3M0MII9_9RHOB|nr:alpha/beta fold hydrolase [Paracoccus alkanivorans]RMC36044.1 alpha/beta hydrolase [Paracoccus alkanivorans]